MNKLEYTHTLKGGGAWFGNLLVKSGSDQLNKQTDMQLLHPKILVNKWLSDLSLWRKDLKIAIILMSQSP